MPVACLLGKESGQIGGLEAEGCRVFTCEVLKIPYEVRLIIVSRKVNDIAPRDFSSLNKRKDMIEPQYTGIVFG